MILAMGPGVMSGILTSSRKFCVCPSLFTYLVSDIQVRSGEEWSHEDASEMMFDDLINHYRIDIPQEDVSFVKDLIKGYPNHSRNK